MPADLYLYMYEPAHEISILTAYIYFCHTSNMHSQLSSGIRSLIFVMSYFMCASKVTYILAIVQTVEIYLYTKSTSHTKKKVSSLIALVLFYTV